jgi:hypothetical protein
LGKGLNKGYSLMTENVPEEDFEDLESESKYKKIKDFQTVLRKIGGSSLLENEEMGMRRNLGMGWDSNNKGGGNVNLMKSSNINL